MIPETPTLNQAARPANQAVAMLTETRRRLTVPQTSRDYFGLAGVFRGWTLELATYLPEGELAATLLRHLMQAHAALLALGRVTTWPVEPVAEDTLAFLRARLDGSLAQAAELAGRWERSA